MAADLRARPRYPPGVPRQALSHPLYFLARPERLTVLDGTHRLLKAYLLGAETVMVKKVPIDRLDDIAVVDE